MPINIEHEEVRTADVEFGGETAAVLFYPRRVTKAYYDELDNGDGDAIDRLIASLVVLIKDWEVIGADGQPLPVTVETLRRLPIDFLSAVSAAIREARVPNPKSRTPSTSG